MSSESCEYTRKRDGPATFGNQITGTCSRLWIPCPLILDIRQVLLIFIPSSKDMEAILFIKSLRYFIDLKRI